jgi:HlyD family secretion protein
MGIGDNKTPVNRLLSCSSGMPNLERDEKLSPEPPPEQFTTTEQLDHLMQVITPWDWLTLATFGGLVLAGLAWGIWGRVTVTVVGRGILIQPRQVIEVQSTVAGQLRSLPVKGGDCVQQGQVLATVEPLELQQQLALAQDKRQQLQAETTTTEQLTSQRSQTQDQAIAATRSSLEQRLRDTQTLTPVLRDQALATLEEQRRSLQQQLDNTYSLLPTLQERLNEREQLQAQGAISQDALLQVQRDYTEAEETIAQLTAQLTTLDQQQTEIEQKYLADLNQVADLEAQLRELDNQTSQFDQETFQTTTQGDRDIQAIDQEIRRLEQQIQTQSQILSPQTGCLLELNATPGQIVQPGLAIGSLQTTDQPTHLQGIAYLPVKDGKQIKPEMSVSITPETVQRERLGGIVGRVTAVSPLPVTREAILATVGNPDLAESFATAQGGVMEIKTELALDPNTPSGYQWTASQGTPEPPTSGTTATLRITLEERAPIAFILPFLQELGRSNHGTQRETP